MDSRNDQVMTIEALDLCNKLIQMLEISDSIHRKSPLYFEMGASTMLVMLTYFLASPLRIPSTRHFDFYIEIIKIKQFNVIRACGLIECLTSYKSSS